MDIVREGKGYVEKYFGMLNKQPFMSDGEDFELEMISYRGDYHDFNTF